MSLAYTAFYLPVKPLKSNSFTGFKPSSLRSPAGRLKLDYRIISNVITIATYATSVPFVWKNGEIFEFRYLVLPFFFKESRVKHCCLPRLKLMKNDKFRNPWKICCEKTVDFFSPILQLYVYVCVQKKVGKLFTQGLDDAAEWNVKNCTATNSPVPFADFHHQPLAYILPGSPRLQRPQFYVLVM